jgi:hypothetical protein
LAFGFLFLTGTAMADIQGVSGSPSPSNVAITGGSVSITWTVSRDSAPPTATLKSTQGVFRAGATVVGTVDKVLARPVTGAVTVTVPESLFVPRNVMVRAQELGFGTLTYKRTFDDTGAAGAGGIILVMTGSSGGAFSIRRIELRFDNDSPIRILPRGEPLRAYALINFNGTGLFQAVWEVADPTSTAGEPIFRPLRIVRQHLTAGRRVKLWSPRLPTLVGGIHLLRLRITEPDPAFDDPLIRYFVAPEPPREVAPPIVSMQLESPRQMSPLAPDTRFAWRAVPGARAYQLEIFSAPPVGAVEPPDTDLYGTPVAEPEGPAGETVTGVLVPGDVTQTSLAALSRQHLEPGRSYRWRVRAIGPQGTFIGASPVRDIYIP